MGRHAERRDRVRLKNARWLLKRCANPLADGLTQRMRFGRICGMENNLQIPYGIFDFKRIRTEGYCYIDKGASLEVERL